jgi:hypothetical protein
MKRYAMAVLLLALVWAPSVLGQTAEAMRRTLKGLKDFNVLIEKLDSEAKDGGLSEEQLKADVEQRLRRAQITVSESSLAAWLYVNVNSMPLKTADSWAFSISIELNQAMTLDRDKSISCLAMTWNMGLIGTRPSREFSSGVREKIGDLVDVFINDYLAENPAGQASSSQGQQGQR